MNRKLRIWMDVRIVSRVTAVLLVLLWIGGNLLLCAIGAWKDRSGTPLLIDQAYSLGVQLITQGRFTPGPVIEILVLLSVLAAVRWLFIRIRIFFGTGPVEVRPLDDASGAGDVDTHRLDVTFREYLTRRGCTRSPPFQGIRTQIRSSRFCAPRRRLAGAVCSLPRIPMPYLAAPSSSPPRCVRETITIINMAYQFRSESCRDMP